MGDWRDNILTDDGRIRGLLRSTKRVAVLGMKTEAQSDQAAFYVPKYLADQGVEVIPVPIYYPEAKEILGKAVYRKVADVPGEVDVLDVFRRPSDILAHLDDIKAKRPRAVWMQAGIRNDRAAEELAREGILVVQDRCLMVEWRRLAG
jgi:uncharacterized protein